MTLTIWSWFRRAKRGGRALPAQGGDASSEALLEEHCTRVYAFSRTQSSSA
jgi:hypothetical protein